MLFNLKQKKKSNQLRNFPGAFAAPFNPLILPGYRAGYMMNYDNDIPPGSINNVVGSGQWFDAVVLGAGSKLMTRGNATVTGLVNGFKCESINTATSRLQNSTIDVFNGVTDCSFILAFNKAAIAAPVKIFGVRNTAGSIGVTLTMRVPGFLEMELSNGVSCIATSVNNYDDATWYAVAGVIDQTNKTVKLITSTGENIIVSNALLNAPVALTYNNQTYFRIGAWWVATETFNPGLIGDFFIFNSAINDSLINAMLAWECNRLGIVHVPI